MARLFACLVCLALLLPTLASATVLVDLASSEGKLSARLIISGDTLLVDDKDQAQLSAADQLLCTLTVIAPEEMTVRLPTFSGQSYGDFTLLDQGESTTRRTSYGLEHERQWLIEPYNPGPYQLPELLISGQQGSMTIELILPRPELLAQEIATDGEVEDLNDILPPQAPGNSRATSIVLAALALATLALAGWLLKHLKNKVPKPLPPKERALAEMALLTELPPRQHIERLAFILRCYLNSRFDLHCLEQTYAEYSPAIAGCGEIPKESCEIFLAVLERCDLIKFSNLTAEPGEAEDIARQITGRISGLPPGHPRRQDMWPLVTITAAIRRMAHTMINQP